MAVTGSPSPVRTPRALDDTSLHTVDDDFYDAREHIGVDGPKHSEIVPRRDEEEGAKQQTSIGLVDATEAKYNVRNKDTGEIYDIRDLSQQPVESYSVFPMHIQMTEVVQEDVKQEKTPRPSIAKMKLKFPLGKTKAKEPNKNQVQVFSSKKDKRDFETLVLAQTIAKHTGTIWAMKFSHDGARLVSGGQDTILRVWKVAISSNDKPGCTTGEKRIIESDPEQSYQGHSMPIVDVSWSRSNFILSASMDKTVRLWHISRDDCLHVFQHPDSVPAVEFHPKEDRYFLSGCFDNKARVWDIPEGCVVSYVQTPAMITAASFNPSGTRAIVGLLNGQCIFYQLNSHQQMNYYTQIECRNSRGPMKKGRKVTGIEFDPEGKYFLVSTNDSRMRLFSVDNYSRICKYKGLANDHLQIKGRFSQDGDYVICGSENGQAYIWNKATQTHGMSLIGSKQDRNASYEHFCAAEPPNAIVTVALFAPASTYAMVKCNLSTSGSGDDPHATNPCTGLIVTASYDGCIKFFERGLKG